MPQMSDPSENPNPIEDETLDRFVVGVAIVVSDKGLILVNKRPDDSYYGGWWEWPGGKARDGENPDDCALRELREEIGLRGQCPKLFDKREARYPGRVVDLHFYLCELEKDSVPSPTALEHRWLSVSDIRELKFLEQNLPVLDKLEEYLAD